jgi:E1A-binding protein p400
LYQHSIPPHDFLLLSTLPLLNTTPHPPRCPIFKVLTYYGSAKARKALRTGWSKLNSFHICITSYQLVVQDANSFRRKRWYYMALDEAHNIKVHGAVCCVDLRKGHLDCPDASS